MPKPPKMRKPKLSEAQLRTLGEIDVDHVEWDAPKGRYIAIVFPHSIRTDVVDRLIRRGYAMREHVGGSAKVILTERGKEILAERHPSEC